MSVGTDWGTLLSAVRATLLTVSGVSRVDLELGAEKAPWVGRLQDKLSLWELSVTGALETDAGAGPQAWEDLTVIIDGYSPYYPKIGSYANWNSLVPRVKDALRANPTLRVPAEVGGTPTIRDAGRPSATGPALVSFPDGEKDTRCHHVTITLNCRGWFSYTFY